MREGIISGTERDAERGALATERNGHETLLREMHHRIKNDLQLISSILSMQIRQLSDERAIAALEDCQSRVQTVAWIHEQMYRSDRVARMELSESIQSLAAGMIRAAAPSGSIALEVTAQPGISLGVEQAIPCGLILNELLTNALKHAFPEGRVGRVRVSAQSTSDGRIAVSVADDGVGLAKRPLAQASESLGWRLVQTLAEQLDAELLVESGTGTTVSVVFQADE